MRELDNQNPGVHSGNIKDPIISIGRQFKSVGLFDGPFALVRPFRPFADEHEADEIRVDIAEAAF